MQVQFLVGKIPWRRAWLPTLVFLPGEPHEKRNLAGYGPYIYIYLMECYSAIKKNEILPFATTLGGHYAKYSKSDKAKYCVISLICGI